MDDLITRALTDMRAGQRVLVLVLGPRHGPFAPLFELARAQLLDGERAQWSGPVTRITSSGGGWIEFRTFGSIAEGGGRGLTLDRVYVDHSVLVEMIYPAVQFDTDRIVFV